MRLSKENTETLKSLANINNEIYIVSGEVGVSPTGKDIIAYYNYGLQFVVPDDSSGNAQDGVGVGDMQEFLSILGMYTNPNIVEQATRLDISEGNYSNRYEYSSKESIVVPPAKTILFDGTDESPAKIQPPSIEFDISKDDFSKLIKQSVILKSPHVQFVANKIKTTDIDDSSANEYEFVVEGVDSADETSCFISAENIQKMVPESYHVKVNESTVVFESADKNLTYVIVCIVE